MRIYEVIHCTLSHSEKMMEDIYSILMLSYLFKYWRVVPHIFLGTILDGYLVCAHPSDRCRSLQVLGAIIGAPQGCSTTCISGTPNERIQYIPIRVQGEIAFGTGEGIA